jgi:hypothetical protein
MRVTTPAAVSSAASSSVVRVPWPIVRTTGLPSTESQGERDKAVARVAGPRRSVPRQLEPPRAFEEHLKCDPQLESGEPRSKAEVDARARHETAIAPAPELDQLGILEDARVSVRGDLGRSRSICRSTIAFPLGVSGVPAFDCVDTFTDLTPSQI